MNSAFTILIDGVWGEDSEMGIFLKIGTTPGTPRPKNPDFLQLLYGRPPRGAFQGGANGIGELLVQN